MNDDINLTHDGDIVVSEGGDISLTESVCQAARIRLRWIQQEWRLGPDLGFPYFEEVFVKNPDMTLISALIKQEVLEVEGVTNVEMTSVIFDKETRSAKFEMEIYAGEEVYNEEVTLYG